MHARIKPLGSPSYGFPPLHKNENEVDIDGRDKRYLHKEENTAIDDIDTNKESYNTGRWGGSEKRLFLEGLRRYGKGRWKQIGKVVKTRSLVQIKSHGQKVLKKLEAGEDIFAELDEDAKVSKVENSFRERHLAGKETVTQQSKSFKEKFLPSYHNDSTESANGTRASASRFAFFLPTRAQSREPEPANQFQNNVETLSSKIRFPPPKKRKGRRKKPKAKVARIDIAMESAGSFMDESSDECSDPNSDLEQDTAVAVHALSTLFLNNRSAKLKTTSREENSTPTETFSGQENVSSSRVEGAHILLSLMGRRSRDTEGASITKELETTQSNTSNQSWWNYGLRRRS